MAESTIRISVTPRQVLAAAAAGVLRFTRWLLYLTFVQYVRLFLLSAIAGAVVSVSLVVFADPVPLAERAAQALGESAASICLASGVCHLPFALTIMALGLYISLGAVVLICASVVAQLSQDEPDPVAQPAAAQLVWHYLGLNDTDRERLMDIVDRIPADIDLSEVIAELRKNPDGPDLFHRLDSLFRQ
jgi:hypothetical protein